VSADAVTAGFFDTPTIIVEEDRVLRLVQVVLDPHAPPDRVAAYADYMAHDLDLHVWCDELRVRLKGLYPADVRLVTTPEELRHELPAAHVVILESLNIGAPELDLAPRLRWVQTFGTSLNHVDQEACARRHVTVRTVRRRANTAVAEHTMMLMLALSRRLTLINGLVSPNRLAAAGLPPRSYDTRYTPGANFGRIPGLRALSGSTLGLLGFGEIGWEVAACARAFGMNVLYHRRSRLAPEAERKAQVTYSSFDELFARSDYVSIHVPSGPATRDLVDASALRRMKRGAFLINTSRASVVNREALLDALANGPIAAAALDVLYEEPLADDDPLLRCENVILTPHVAGGSRMNGLADMEEMLVGIAAHFRSDA
jgi:phosphoglycerate dehydrogenase-like enzyme